MIANAACAGHPDCLVRSGMEWCFDRPANSTRKPIMNKIGFQVMITSLLEQKKDWTITVSMPPPTKHTNDVPWPTAVEDNGNDGEPVDYDHTAKDLMSTAATLSICEQIAGIDQASAVPMNALLDRYKIRESPLFLHKRIYSDGDHHFELNDMRLHVWAVAIVWGTASIEKPPVSTHFSETQRIQPSTVQAAVPSTMPAIPPVPVVLPIPAAAPISGTQDLLLQLALVMLRQQPLPHQQLPIAPSTSIPALPLSQNPVVPATLAPPLAAPITAPVSPPKGLKLPQPVLCCDFCNRYEISASDEAKLDKLKFIPDNRGIEELRCEDWQGDAGFTKLAWECVLKKHCEFLADVGKGLWDIELAAS